MIRSIGIGILGGLIAVAGAQEASSAAPAKAAEHDFRDAHYGVSFVVPPGWAFSRHDHEVSTFRLDARSATLRSEMRGVASMDFNPFPRSTFAGALVYYSVARHSNEGECAKQAKVEGVPVDVLDIGGMSFLHGHDEHGGMCVEARDDMYTAYRKGSCYRFDLVMNTFCAEASGAREITPEQMKDIETRMAGILSTVKLDWSKGGGGPVAPPSVDAPRRKLPTPERVPAPVGIGAGR